MKLLILSGLGTLTELSGPKGANCAETELPANIITITREVIAVSFLLRRDNLFTLAIVNLPILPTVEMIILRVFLNSLGIIKIKKSAVKFLIV